MTDWFRNAGAAYAVLSALVLSCATERGTNGRDSGPEGTYIDEPIILAWSGPFVASENDGNEYIFDLSGDTLVQTGRCNDISLDFLLNQTCSGDIAVWDCASGEWRPLPYFNCCQFWVCRLGDALSTWGIPTSAVLDTASRARWRLFIPNLPARIWTLELHPEYWMIPQSSEELYGDGSIAYVDGYFHAVLRYSPMLGRLDRSGQVVSRLPLPVDHPAGLAFDGENMWILGVPDTLFKVSLDGEVLCALAMPTIWDGDLAWDGETLWFAESGYEHPSIWGIDPVASCESGEVVITDTLPSPGVMDAATGLAWDGSHLLVTTQDHGYDSHLFRVALDGTVTDSVALPVEYVSGATWDGSRLCLISNGPLGPMGHSRRERTIACFKLRW